MYSMTWNGRQLMSMSMNGGQYYYAFTYNDEGIRTSKTVGSTVHYYTLNGSQIISEQWGAHLLVFLYDESGAPIGLQYRNTSYAEGDFDTFYYEKNVFGDIIGIYTADGTKIGSYKYDAWGTVSSSTVSGTTSLQQQIVRNYNPFRYRGYYYDTNSSLYYLQSRYYDPSTGRFINADGYISTGTGLLGYNMYAYCNNNPVMNVDPKGFCVNCTCSACMVGLLDECPTCWGVVNSNGDTTAEPMMSEEERVISSKGIVRYKDTWVVKVPFMGNSSFSFGIIFMGYEGNEQLLRHEYGHFIHLKQIGPQKYWKYVVMPSLELYWSGVPMDEYYNYPTEYIADFLGGVERPNYDYWPNAKKEAMDYYFKTLRPVVPMNSRKISKIINDIGG